MALLATSLSTLDAQSVTRFSLPVLACRQHAPGLYLPRLDNSNTLVDTLHAIIFHSFGRSNQSSLLKWSHWAEQTIHQLFIFTTCCVGHSTRVRSQWPLGSNCNCLLRLLGLLRLLRNCHRSRPEGSGKQKEISICTQIVSINKKDLFPCWRQKNSSDYLKNCPKRQPTTGSNNGNRWDDVRKGNQFGRL